jgi:hypothetical protein
MDKETNQPHKNVPYDTQPAGLEKALDGVFFKKSPMQLPPNVTKWLADNSWWIVLVGAVASVLSIFSLLSLVNTANNIDALYNTYGLGDTYARSTNSLYVSMIASAVSAVLLFMASSKLKAHQKAGWNLVYYNFLINAVISLVSFALSSPGLLAGSLIGFAIGFVIGAYLLFQLRGHFSK